MARFNFGGEVTQAVVAPNATYGNTLALAPGAAIPWYDAAGGNLVNDFLVFNVGSGAFAAASSIVATSTGNLPRFQGPDGLSTLFTPDGGGGWLRLIAYDATTVTPASWSTLSGKPSVIAAGDDAAGAQTALGLTATGKAVAGAASSASGLLALGLTAADVPSKAGDNDWSGQNNFGSGTIPATSLGSLDTRLDSYRISKGLPMIGVFTTGVTPPVVAGTLWLEEVTAAAPSQSLVMHQADTTNQASYPFTPEASMPSSTDYYIAVWGGDSTKTSASPVGVASSVSGRGLTWTKLGTGIVSTAGINSMVIFRGTGSPTASGAITVNFPAAIQGCHVEMIAVTRGGTPTQTKYGNTTSTAPALTYDAPASAGKFELLFILWNSSTNTITTDPGTAFGTTPELASTNPSMVSRASYRAASQTTSTWAKSGSAQQVSGKVEIPAV